jgi:hypothetical protein
MLQFLRSPGFKLAYNIFSWVTLAGAVVTIIMVLHKSPPPVVAADPTAAARVEQKFAAADQATSTGQPAQVELDSTELNSYLAQNLQLEGSTPQAPPAATPPSAPGALSSSPASQSEPSLQEVQSSVRDVKVDMEGNLIKAYVIFNLHGEDLSLQLEGRLAAQNGYLRFQPVDGQIGSLPLPQSALDSAVTQLMDSPQNREQFRLPDDVSDIRIANGQVVISYK